MSPLQATVAVTTLSIVLICLPAFLWTVLIRSGLAAAWLKYRQRKSPQDTNIATKLGYVYLCQMFTKKGEGRTIAANEAFSQYDNWYKRAEDLGISDYSPIKYLLVTAFEAGHYDKAEQYARELVELANKRQRSRLPNTLHNSYMVLGRLALKMGDLESAKIFLQKASSNLDSPQLSSFGPNMALAKELLAQGETSAVLEYLDVCEKAWPLGRRSIVVWRSQIHRGIIPDFGRNGRV